jgi:hypothetical protein
MADERRQQLRALLQRVRPMNRTEGLALLRLRIERKGNVPVGIPTAADAIPQGRLRPALPRGPWFNDHFWHDRLNGISGPARESVIP